MMQRSLSCPVFVDEVEEHLQGFPITTLRGEFRDKLTSEEKHENSQKKLFIILGVK